MAQLSLQFAQGTPVEPVLKTKPFSSCDALTFKIDGTTAWERGGGHCIAITRNGVRLRPRGRRCIVRHAAKSNLQFLLRVTPYLPGVARSSALTSVARSQKVRTASRTGWTRQNGSQARVGRSRSGLIGSYGRPFSRRWGPGFVLRRWDLRRLAGRRYELMLPRGQNCSCSACT